jgi:hypothetical protein
MTDGAVPQPDSTASALLLLGQALTLRKSIAFYGGC